jgi:hypothetical protein
MSHTSSNVEDNKFIDENIEEKDQVATHPDVSSDD